MSSSRSSSPSPPPPPAPAAPASQGRRSLVMATALGACALAAAAAGPSIALAFAPLQSSSSKGSRWVRTVKLDQLKEGEARRVAIIDDRKDAWTIERNVELGSVWLVRRGEKVVAFSAVCPHLGCSVNVVAAGSGSGGFACPCHTSAFDPSGKRTSGPSPRDLDALETKIEPDGIVSVDFRRFRIGVEEKVETT
jgi:menaquinol-cytochrome c reductase iron-sulfur subunit